MDRTVPKTGSEEIELYMRTYYSLLRSTDAIQIETLVESHMAMESSLHVKARAAAPDVAALTYSTLRLPPVMPAVDFVVLGQIERSFRQIGYHDVGQWQRVNAAGRRRRAHYDGENTLAVFIASRSDIDDLVPILTAYQIEWNKLHILLQNEVARLFLNQNQGRTEPLTAEEDELIASVLKIDADDLARLKFLWADDFTGTLAHIMRERKSISLHLLSSSLAAYRKATAYWWRELEDAAQDAGIEPEARPVYFVSSNTHSLPNLLTGFAWREENAIIDYVRASGQRALLDEYEAIRQRHHDRSLYNYLYYVLKKYIAHQGPDAETRQLEDERAAGIYRIPNEHGFQIAAQIIEMNRLRADWMDPRLCSDLDSAALAASDALIINIDYPLGMSAYEILNRITEQVGGLMGVYVLGKAATLNGRIGDVMIPSVVHDEHSQNTYLFGNCFSARDVAPFLAYGMVLDNQKAISAPGTFLQNTNYMSVFYREGYTDIEMEAGPYLSAIYEAHRPKRHPQNEIVNLFGLPFDLGFLHYASDTPMSKGHNLGSSNLSYAGVDPTYASSIAILRRILSREADRVRRHAEASPAPKIIT